MPNLIVSNNNTIAVCSGVSGTIVTSFGAPYQCTGSVFTGQDLVTVSSYGPTAYVHSGISSTIKNSFSLPIDYPKAIGFDGKNLLVSAYYGTYVFSGISGTIFRTTYATSGIAFTGSQTVITKDSTDEIRVYNGVLGSSVTSFSSPGTTPRGVTVIGGNLISVNYSSPERVYVHSGLTSTITTSFYVIMSPLDATSDTVEFWWAASNTPQNLQGQIVQY